jgi:DNA polymerase
MTKQDKQKKLDKIAKDLATKSPCPLRPTAINAVPGAGNPDADIMFIGEAPGKKEDETGLPFVGAAGRILDELLAVINLKRDDVFITSVEKFRPPKNRDPKPEEIMACFPYLEAQIKVIEPKIIVCLGRHSLKRMMEWEENETIGKTISISQLHGHAFEGKNGLVYYPIYHPAAVLYGFNKEILIEDMKKIPKILEKLETK